MKRQPMAHRSPMAHPERIEVLSPAWETLLLAPLLLAVIFAVTGLLASPA